MIRIAPHMAQSFRNERSVEDFHQIETDVVRRCRNRWTGHFVRDGQAFFLKVHRATGWRFVIDELIHLRWPQIGARAEWRALTALRQTEIPVAEVAAFGESGFASPWQHSFLVTKEIPATISLETLFQGEAAPRPGSIYRRRLIRAVAGLVRRLHSAGFNHRDLYLCHLLLDVSGGVSSLHSQEPRLYLMDLHRAQRRRFLQRRWIIKDLAGLLFSAACIQLTAREQLLFARIYHGVPARKTAFEHDRLWRQVRERAAKLYRKYHERVAKPAAAAQWSTA